jgi:hypothetical protein
VSATTTLSAPQRASSVCTDSMPGSFSVSSRRPVEWCAISAAYKVAPQLDAT